MVTKIKRAGESGNKKEVVNNYSKRPQNFETYFYCSSEIPQDEWRKFQKYVKRRYPIMRRVRKFIKALADNYQLKPHVVASLEDCFRGYSQKMQITMLVTLHTYICYNDLVTTGVKQVDNMIRYMLCKIYNNR